MAQEKAHTLLKKRYPGLAFLLSMESDQELVSRPVDHIQLPDISDVDLLYLFDFSLGHVLFDRLSIWLKESEKRHVVLMDVGIAAAAAFLTLDTAEKLLDNPRVHLRLPMSEEQIESMVVECAAHFPVEKIQLLVSPFYKSMYKDLIPSMQTALYTHTVHEHALLQEGLYSHVFFDNFVRNITSKQASFLVSSLKGCFKEIPAIICGAGPSLNKDLETIKKLDDRALIIGAGSAVTALSQNGVNFHIAMAVDPNEEEVVRFQDALSFETVLMHSNRMHHRVLETVNGSFAVIQTNSNPFELAFAKVCDDEEPLAEGFGIGAMSVTTAALEVATAMGCSPIILAGVDLAYTGGHHYASGVVKGEKTAVKPKRQDMRCSEKLIESYDIWGKSIYTLSKWEMESKAIASFIQRQGGDRYLNATGGGIGIEGMKNVALETLEFKAKLDIQAMLHHHIQQAKKVDQEKVGELLDFWNRGAKKGLEISQQACARLKEMGDKSGASDGKMIYFQSCFCELEVYETLFLEPEKAFMKLARLSILPSSWSKVDEQRAIRDQKELIELWDYRLYVAGALMKSFCDLQKQRNYATT